MGESIIHWGAKEELDLSNPSRITSCLIILDVALLKVYTLSWIVKCSRSKNKRDRAVAIAPFIRGQNAYVRSVADL